MKITILGSGAYGIALALMFHQNPCSITMWTKFEEEKEMLEKKRCHEKVLPKITIPNDISFSTNMQEAIAESNLIVIATPVAFVDSVAKELASFITPSQHLLIASKGIEQHSCLFVHEIILKHIQTNKIAVISGPTFAVDMASLVPCGLSLASNNFETKNLVKKALQNNFLKLCTSTDILGIEICGSIKNVLAIASGIIDGMQMPISTTALFITESLYDIQKLIESLGGDKNSVLSFAGFGDLFLTCTSSKSRNFTLGKYIGEGRSQKEVEDYMSSTTIEGLYTLKAISKLLKDKQLSMPIVDLIEDIIYNRKEKETLLRFLIEKK